MPEKKKTNPTKEHLQGIDSPTPNNPFKGGGKKKKNHQKRKRKKRTH
jgi:hypothetical protein